MKRKPGIDSMKKRKGALMEDQTEVKMPKDKTTRSNWYIQNNAYILSMDSRDGKSMVGNFKINCNRRPNELPETFLESLKREV